MNKQELYELKMKLISMINNPESVARIVASLESDKEKLDWIYSSRNPKGKATVIASLGISDDEKIKLLRLLLSPKDKAIVVASLESDDKKIELLDRIRGNTEYPQARVIESLKSDDLKIACLSGIENVRVRAKIIASLQSDENKVELIRTIQDESLQGLIISSIRTREIKEKLIQLLTSENIKKGLREKIEEELVGKSEEEIVRYIRAQRARSRQGRIIARCITREELQYAMFKECRVRSGTEEHSRSVYYLQSVGLLGKSDDDKIAHIVGIADAQQKYHVSEVLESLSGDGLKKIIEQYSEIYRACIQRSGPIQLARMIEQVVSIVPEEKKKSPLEEMSMDELQGLGDKIGQEIEQIKERFNQDEGIRRKRLIATIEGQMGELESLKRELASLEAQVQLEKSKEGIGK